MMFKCIMSFLHHSKSILDPIGNTKYSVKALRREPTDDGTEKIFTNTNGLTM